LRLPKTKVNWTTLLGQVMAVCNSHSGTQKHSVLSYEAVFGQKYHPQLKCNMSEMRECRSIFQRLKLSPDERLQTYVWDHDIVDIELDSAEFDDNDSLHDTDKEEGVELGDDAFPELMVNEDDSMEHEFQDCYEGLVDPGMVDGDGDNNDGEQHHNMDPLVVAPQGDNGDDVVVSAPTVSPPVLCQITLDSPPPVAHEPYTEPFTFHVSEYSIFTVQAWDHGNIARSYQSLGTRQEFQFVWPTLTCCDCCFPHGSTQIQVGDNDYVASLANTTNWYDGVFISLFAQLAVHYVHITYNKRPSISTQVNMPLLIQVTFPKQTLVKGQYKALPQDVTTVVAVLHDADHYAVLEIDIPNKKVHVYDGLYRDLDRWVDHVFSAMKRCMLCDLQAAHLCESDQPKMMTLGASRHPRLSIEGYKLTVGNTEWKFQRGHFIKQVDLFSCGPIACAKILEMFHLTSPFEVKLAYDTNSICNLVTGTWTCFITCCESDLILQVREQIPLRTPTAEEGDVVLPLRNRTSTAPIVDPVIAAAAAASAQAEIDHHKLCFCCCDSPDLELVRVQCCQQTYHHQCLQAHLGTNSLCAYCRSAVIKIAGVLALPTIDRSEILSVIMSPPQRTPTEKRDLQLLWMDETPLRIADTLRTESQEKNKRDNSNRQKR
jgi:hypothetical protein